MTLNPNLLLDPDAVLGTAVDLVVGDLRVRVGIDVNVGQVIRMNVVV